MSEAKIKGSYPPNIMVTACYSWTFMRAAVVFLIGAILGVMALQFEPVLIDIEMRTQEEGFLQYYFDTGKGFNEAQKKRITLSASPEFSHYAMSISNVNKLYALRVDPLETPGQFEIRSFQISFFFWHRQWHAQELKYLIPAHEIEIFFTEKNLLSGQAKGNDPFFIIRDLEYLKYWQLIATIVCALFGGATAFLLLALVRYFGGVKALLEKEHTPLFILITIATVLRVIYWEQSSFLPSEPSLLRTRWPDEGRYFEMAQHIMSHGLREYFLAEQSVMIAPGNPLYIALLYTIFNSVTVIRAVNLLFSILSIVLIYKLGKRIFSKPVGLLAAGTCAVHGQLIQFSVTILTEPLFLFFFISGIYCLQLTLETDSPPPSRLFKYALASSFFLTGATLTRSILMLLPVFLLAAIGLWETYWSWRVGKPAFPLLKRAALPLLVPMLIVNIIAFKNYIVFDHFMVATGSGAALWLGSRVDTEGDEPPYRRKSYRTNEITGPGVSHLTIQSDMLLMLSAKKNIREAPLDYAWWNVKKVGRLLVGSNLAWFYPHKNISDWYHHSKRNFIDAAKMVFAIVLASSIAVYGMMGLVTTRWQQPFSLITSVSVSYLILFSIPFLVNQRYGLPVIMLLVIPSSAFIYDAWRNPGKQRVVGIVSIPLVLAIVFYILFLG